MIIFDEPIEVVVSGDDDNTVQSIIESIEADNDTTLQELSDYYVAATLDSVGILTANILENVTEDDIEVDATEVRDFMRKRAYSGYLGDISFAESNILDKGVGRYHIANEQVEPFVN